MEDLYRILQVDPAADPEIIEAAWRRLARLYHPDGERPDPERMTAINVAHDILKDPVKRAQYDRQRAAAERTSGERTGTGRQPRRYPPDGQPGTQPPPWNPPRISCWRHPTSPAVSWCANCHAYLCAACAAHWSAHLCDACVRREAVRRQWQLLWPAAALAAWLVVAAFELDLLLTYRLGIASAVGLLAVGFYLGPGAVGVVDLAWLAFTHLPGSTVRAAIGALSWLALLILCPISLLAGSVMAVVRAALAVPAFVEGRRLQRDADAFLAR